MISPTSQAQAQARYGVGGLRCASVLSAHAPGVALGPQRSGAALCSGISMITFAAPQILIQFDEITVR